MCIWVNTLTVHAHYVHNTQHISICTHIHTCTHRHAISQTYIYTHAPYMHTYNTTKLCLIAILCLAYVDEYIHTISKTVIIT